MSQQTSCLLILPRDKPEESIHEFIDATLGTVQLVCYTDLSEHPEAPARWIRNCIQEQGYCLLPLERLQDETAERMASLTLADQPAG